MGAALRTGLAALAAALTGNLCLLGVAHALDAELRVPHGTGGSGRVGLLEVALTTTLPMLLGLGLTLALVRHRRLLAALAALAAVGTILSLHLPLSLDSDAATRVTLGLMHLVPGAAFLSVVGGQLRRLGQEPVDCPVAAATQPPA